jgi:hypothetical protein
MIDTASILSGMFINGMASPTRKSDAGFIHRPRFGMRRLGRRYDGVHEERNDTTKARSVRNFKNAQISFPSIHSSDAGAGRFAFHFTVKNAPGTDERVPVTPANGLTVVS